MHWSEASLRGRAPVRIAWARAPRLAAAAVIVCGAAATLWLNLPGHLSWDSVTQLAEGRTGIYAGLHPPVMSWLLGLMDRASPGAALFVVFDTLMIAGALAALVLVARPASWLAALLAAAAWSLPQLSIYPAIVWKDVLFAGAASAGFACLAWAAERWASPGRRLPPLAGALALLSLASLARQNGAVVLPFAAAAVGWIAARAGVGARRAWAQGLGFAAAGAAIVLAASAALDTRIEGPAAPAAQQWRDLQIYDLAGALAKDPGLDLGVLHARAPWLERLLRSDGVAAYAPSRIDPLTPVLDQLAGHADVSAPVAAQWRDLIARHPLLYARVRSAAFVWVLLTPRPSECVLVGTGVDGDPDDMAAAGVAPRRTARDNALAHYALALGGTPVFDHAAYGALGALLLVLLLRRRRPADIAVAAMLASALVFAASFALISIACDYRYLYDLDLAVIAAGLYAAASLGSREPADHRGP